jgi:acetyl-CoA synthetase
VSYGELDQRAARFASFLAGLGIGRGDVIAVHTGPRIETGIAHLAAYKLGAIVATLSQLYGPDTLKHILLDSGARILVTQDTVWAPMRHLRRQAPALEHCIVVGAAQHAELPFTACVIARGMTSVVRTRAEDPALLVYTSGSTGMPKGIMHGHRIVHAYRTSLDLFYNLELEEPNLVFWTSADWAWIGGLVDVVFPVLMFGHPVVASSTSMKSGRRVHGPARHHHGLMADGTEAPAQVSKPRELGPQAGTIFTARLPGETLQWLKNELHRLQRRLRDVGGQSHDRHCRWLRAIKPGSMGWEFRATLPR